MPRCMLPDSSEAAAAAEVRQVAQEIADLGPLPPCAQAPVALIVSYESAWMTDIQPQGRDFHWLKFAMALYTAARELGTRCRSGAGRGSAGRVSAGAGAAASSCRRGCPRQSARTGRAGAAGAAHGIEDRRFPDPRHASAWRAAGLAAPSDRLGREPRPGIAPRVNIGEEEFSAQLLARDRAHRAHPSGQLWRWRRRLVCARRFPLSRLLAGQPSADTHRVGAGASGGADAADAAEGVRMRGRGDLIFAINFSTETHTTPAPADAEFVLGNRHLPPAGVAAWREG